MSDTSEQLSKHVRTRRVQSEECICIYISVICFIVGLGLAEIICCICTKVVFLEVLGDCVVAWNISIKFVICLSSENCSV